MTRLPEQFLEDRALRDAARDVFMADIEHARASFSGKGIASRVGGRIGDGAKDVVEAARTNADDNRGILAMLIGAVLLFFAREPILEVLGFTGSSDDEESSDGEPMATDIAETETEAALDMAAVGEQDER